MREGKPIFGDVHLDQLKDTLTRDIGGCTTSMGVTHPLFEGTWINPRGGVVRDQHAKIMGYVSQTMEGQSYFRQLQDDLQEFTGEAKILVEMIPVVLL